jgi:hypothetical protein
MSKHWTKSNWTEEQLERKSVEFRIRRETGIASGLGEFLVSENPDGLLSIDICTDTQGRNYAERIQTRFPLAQPDVDRILRHPNPKEAEFQLHGIDAQ